MLLKMLIPFSAPNDMAIDELVRKGLIRAYMLKEPLIITLGLLMGPESKDFKKYGGQTLFGSNIW